MGNFDQFKYYTNEINKFLVKLYGYPSKTTFGEAVNLSKHKNTVIKRYYEILRVYIDLRNVLTHESLKNGLLAEPSDEVVSMTEKIYKALKSPSNVSEYITDSVVSFNLTDSVSNVLEIVHKDGYTFFPIFDDKSFLGMLTADGISKGIAKYAEDDIISLKEILINDVINLDDNKVNCELVRTNTTVYDAVELFETSSIKNGQPLSLLISDGNVSKHSDIRGIITYWDIEKMRKKINI